MNIIDKKEFHKKHQPNVSSGQYCYESDWHGDAAHGSHFCIEETALSVTAAWMKHQ